MEILPLFCFIFVALAGLTKGFNSLPMPYELDAAVGGTVMFRTTLTPTAKPFTKVQWKFYTTEIITVDGGNTTASPEYEGRINLSKSTGSLELRSLTLKDAGFYRVTILPQGQIYELKGSTKLNVYEPISSVVVTSNSTELVEFSSISLSCSCSGSSPSFVWLNGSSEVKSHRVRITDGGATLIIVTVTHYDQGPFRCRASNPVSTVTSDPVVFNTFYYGPENVQLSIYPLEEYYDEGSDVTLSCSADSVPPAEFIWFHSTIKLPDTGPELRLVDITWRHDGKYRCRAFNQKTQRYETSQNVRVDVKDDLFEVTTDSSISMIIIIIVVVGVIAIVFTAATCIYKQQQWLKRSSPSMIGFGSQDIVAHAGSQEPSSTPVMFFRTSNGGIVQVGQSESAEYTLESVNNGFPASSAPSAPSESAAPPSYDDCMRRPAPYAPHPDAYGAPYNQDQEN